MFCQSDPHREEHLRFDHLIVGGVEDVASHHPHDSLIHHGLVGGSGQSRLSELLPAPEGGVGRSWYRTVWTWGETKTVQSQLCSRIKKVRNRYSSSNQTAPALILNTEIKCWLQRPNVKISRSLRGGGAKRGGQPAHLATRSCRRRSCFDSDLDQENHIGSDSRGCHRLHLSRSLHTHSKPDLQMAPHDTHRGQSSCWDTCSSWKEGRGRTERVRRNCSRTSRPGC